MIHCYYVFGFQSFRFCFKPARFFSLPIFVCHLNSFYYAIGLEEKKGICLIIIICVVFYGFFLSIRGWQLVIIINFLETLVIGAVVVLYLRNNGGNLISFFLPYKRSYYILIIYFGLPQRSIIFIISDFSRATAIKIGVDSDVVVIRPHQD